MLIFFTERHICILAVYHCYKHKRDVVFLHTAQNSQNKASRLNWLRWEVFLAAEILLK